MHSTAHLGTLSYGVATLVKNLTGDIQTELLQYFSPIDVSSMLAICAVKVAKASITSASVASHYQTSFASVYWPEAEVSEPAIVSLLERLGSDDKKRDAFFKERIAAACKNSYAVIDGTLMQGTSHGVELSNFSYEMLNDKRSLAVLYALDVKRNEPICADVFHRNCIDASSFAHFIEQKGLDRGIIFTGNNFSLSSALALLKTPLDLHAINPLKIDEELIDLHSLHQYDGAFGSKSGYAVLYKKVLVNDSFFLYSFCETGWKGAIKTKWLDDKAKTKQLAMDKFREKHNFSNTVEFVSDLDLLPEEAYRYYSERCLGKLAFTHYQGSLKLQSDASVKGSTFINFLCTLISCRIISVATKAGLLNYLTYGKLIDLLDQTLRKIDAPLDKLPESDDGYWPRCVNTPFWLLAPLGLCKDQVNKSQSSADKARIMMIELSNEGPQQCPIELLKGKASTNFTKSDLEEKIQKPKPYKPHPEIQADVKNKARRIKKQPKTD